MPPPIPVILARAYENEKRRARDLHPDDSHAYTDAKAAWIRETQAKALIWFRDQKLLSLMK